MRGRERAAVRVEQWRHSKDKTRLREGLSMQNERAGPQRSRLRSSSFSLCGRRFSSGRGILSEKGLPTTDRDPIRGLLGATNRSRQDARNSCTSSYCSAQSAARESPAIVPMRNRKMWTIAILTSRSRCWRLISSISQTTAGTQRTNEKNPIERMHISITNGITNRRAFVTFFERNLLRCSLSIRSE